MNSERLRLEPGRILQFLHLHTNDIRDFSVLCEIEDQKKLCAVQLAGKIRPMLLLWEDGRGHYTLLYMTSKDMTLKGQPKIGPLVEAGEESYIDCGRYFEYSEHLRQVDREIKLERLKRPVWTQVMEHLPTQMRNLLTDIELDCRLKSGHEPL